MRKIVYDTNALLTFSHTLSDADYNIIPEIVIDELDHIKSGFNEKAFLARQAVRKIKSLSNVLIDTSYNRSHPLLDSSKYGKNDDIIVECAFDHSASLATGDYLAELKAKSRGIEVIETFTSLEDDYTGYKEVVLNDEQLANFYETTKENKFNLYTNQYLIIKNSLDDVIEIAKWNGEYIDFCNSKGFKSSMFGQFKAYDHYQICAVDSLLNNQMTMLKGKAGSGKSLIALNYAWSMIEKQKYDKLIIFTNPVAARNSAKLGFYPGTRIEKLLESQTGTMLASKFGDMSELQKQIQYGKIQLLPFADIRGFDTTGMKAIVWFIECQNLDISLMKLGISRCGDDSKVILDGDYSQQVDMDAYAGMNNGMRRVSEVFKGQSFYGEVQLNHVYRSKMATMADLL